MDEEKFSEAYFLTKIISEFLAVNSDLSFIKNKILSRKDSGENNPDANLALLMLNFRILSVKKSISQITLKLHPALDMVKEDLKLLQMELEEADSELKEYVAAEQNHSEEKLLCAYKGRGSDTHRAT